MLSTEVLRDPRKELRISHSNVLAVERLEVVFALLVGSAQPKGIFEIPGRLGHGQGMAIEWLARRCLPPPLSLARPDHSIFQSLHPHVCLGLEEVLLERSIERAGLSFAVPLSKLVVRLEVGRVKRHRIAIVVGLKQDVLDDLGVGGGASRLGEDLADWAENWADDRYGAVGAAFRNGANAGVDAADADEGHDWRVVVLELVAVDKIVALGQPECIEAVGELGILAHFLGEDVHRLVHGHEEAIQRVRNLVVPGGDARGINSVVRTGLLRDALHAGVETRVTHAVGHDDRQGAVRRRGSRWLHLKPPPRCALGSQLPSKRGWIALGAHQKRSELGR